MASGANMEFNTANATKVSKNITNRASEIDVAMKQVKQQMDSVSSWWVGDSQKAFTAQYEKISGNVKKLIESVNTISKQLEETSKAKIAEENAIKAELNQTK